MSSTIVVNGALLVNVPDPTASEYRGVILAENMPPGARGLVVAMYDFTGDTNGNQGYLRIIGARTNRTYWVSPKVGGELGVDADFAANHLAIVPIVPEIDNRYELSFTKTKGTLVTERPRITIAATTDISPDNLQATSAPVTTSPELSPGMPLIVGIPAGSAPFQILAPPAAGLNRYVWGFQSGLDSAATAKGVGVGSSILASSNLYTGWHQPGTSHSLILPTPINIGPLGLYANSSGAGAGHVLYVHYVDAP